MPATFPPWSNTVFGVALASLAALALCAVATPMVLVRTSYGTGQFDAIEQPVLFDHRHHVRDDAIDCLYCHPGAENEPAAGIPSTALCMGCHGQIWPDSPLLAPVRASFASGVPIPWRRVYALPDHVYFHHGRHTQAGVTCVACHGDVASMAAVYRVTPLTMDWCLDCHRDPPGPAYHGRAVTMLTTCTACHR